MSHTRAHIRFERGKWIKHRRNIVMHIWGNTIEQWNAPEGSFSKNKVHCSCSMCRSKTNDTNWNKGRKPKAKNWKHSDLKKIG